jgi:hypothetical protein
MYRSGSMPNYDFKNTVTGEVKQYTMSYTKLEEFKEQNPNLEQFHSAENLPVMSDGMRLNVPGLAQPHMAFETGVIQRMQESIPGNTMAGHKTKRPRQW